MGRHRLLSWCAMAVDVVGTATTGATNGAIGTGATVFRTGIPRTLGTQVGAIPTMIGPPHHLNRSDRRALKTATDRAVEAIEAAEKIFADEMGGTSGLSPAAKIALIGRSQRQAVAGCSTRLNLKRRV